MTSYNHVIADLPIYKAALFNDWESVSQIFKQNPELMTKQITYWHETPLLMAVGTNRSNEFVKKLVESIIATGESEKLFNTSWTGNNPLHYAAMVGNTIAARIMVEQDPSMTLVSNGDPNTPVLLAARHGNKETLEYLLTVTPDLVGEEGSPYTGVSGGDLITRTIMAGLYDVALKIIEEHPDIVLEKDRNSLTALQAIAMKPEFFPSGSKLGFWGGFVYSSSAC